MKNFIQLIILLSILSFSANSQNLHHFYQNNGIPVYDSNSNKLDNAFGGGLQFPVFAGIDLNNDFKTDFVILDKIDNRILTYINIGNGDTIDFTYAPQYEALFPDTLSSFIIFRDYNNDGLLDLFTYSGTLGAGISAYKNIGDDLSDIRFKLEEEQLTTHFGGNFEWYTNLPMFTVDIPALIDIDGDGDMDVLTFDPLGGSYMRLYNNISKEVYGNVDSFVFSCIDEYWGYFMEHDESNEVFLNNKPPDWMGSYKNYSEDYSNYDSDVKIFKNNFYEERAVRHAGSTVFANDMDNDGDVDLLVGDVEFPGIVFLENGKNDNSQAMDSIINCNMNFPSYDKPIDIMAMPAIYYIDVNRDGIRDMITAPTDKDIKDSFETLNQIWLYTNKGENNNPDMEFVQDDFLQNEMIDLGGATYPAFFDYDADGDKDLFIATIGSYYTTYFKNDRIFLYENIGKSDSNVFKLIDDDYLGLSANSMEGITINFGDYNGDNVKDLVMGVKNGNVLFYKNEAAVGNIADFKRDSIPFTKILGGYSAPFLIDLNKDSLMDIVVGQYFGKLNYYKNTGTKNTPVFTLVNDTFGGVFFEQGNHFTTPAIADLDNNGHLDMVVGANTWRKSAGITVGHLYFYKDIDIDLNASFTSIDTLIYDSINKKIVKRSLGLKLRPTIARMDADSFPDIIVGSARGGLMFFGTFFDTTIISIPPRITKNDFKFDIYPNPVRNKFYLSINSTVTKRLKIRITDILGNTVKQEILTVNNTEVVNVSDFKQGVYIVIISDTKGKVQGIKRIVKY